MNILNIALPVPLRNTFDYLAGDVPIEKLIPGVRVLVPFGKRKQQVGVLLNVSSATDVTQEKLKKIISVIDPEPVFSKTDLNLLRWTADYYHHPIGEVLFNAIPAVLRKGRPARFKVLHGWTLSEKGELFDPESLVRAPKQTALLKLLRTHSKPVTTVEIETKLTNSRPSLLALEKKGLAVKFELSEDTPSILTQTNSIELNSEQARASQEVIDSLETKQVFLLDGVTGSGKTEVYISVIQAVIDSGKQVLILSPEIGLTPQLLDRITTRSNARVRVLHSGLSDAERLHAWLDAKNGAADVILGTRSAIWTPLKNPGLFIVDEEHDLSYKQQDGLRYSARDIAVMRGNLSNSPVLLGSATPSLESLHNVGLKKFRLLKLDRRAGEASIPTVAIIDLRNRAMKGAFSQELLVAIDNELSSKNQVMLFLNRRGYSPTIMCHQCAWIAKCERCDVNLTYHKQRNTLSCHHCDRSNVMPEHCPDCGNSTLLEIGHGTERLTATLQECFPSARVLRIDRDSTRRKGSIAAMLQKIKEGDIDILVGTQMLAKGHHFPKLTLVGIIDTDGGLCSSDFRASERMAQLFVQVSGRAGREKTAGSVLLQTHFPDHPLLHSLINTGYRKFANELLKERQETNLPPYSYLALLRSEGHQLDVQQKFLEKASVLLENLAEQLQIFGPIPAPMEKLAGKLRMQLLVFSNTRASLRRALQSCCPAIEKLPEARKVRWSLDIDPQDMM